jgi:RHS repeat-associated protein
VDANWVDNGNGCAPPACSDPIEIWGDHAPNSGACGGCGPTFGIWTDDANAHVCFGEATNDHFGGGVGSNFLCVPGRDAVATWQMFTLYYNGPSGQLELFSDGLLLGGFAFSLADFSGVLGVANGGADVGNTGVVTLSNNGTPQVSLSVWSYSEWLGSAADNVAGNCGSGNPLCSSGSGSGCDQSHNAACTYLAYLYNAIGTGETLQQEPLKGGPVTQSETAGDRNCSCSNPNLGQDTQGDPVNTSSGNFSETVTDLSIPGRGIPLAFTRTYNSQAASTSGPLGNGWASNLFMSLTQPGGTGPVTIIQEGGARVIFNQSGTTYSPAAPRDIDTLTHNGDGSWTLVRLATTTFTFSSAGLLTSEKDLNGYTTTFGYNGASELTTITDPALRTISLGWTGNDVTSVSDDNVSPARQVSLRYNDGAGNLTDVIDVNGGHTHFVYDANHRMTNMFDPNCYAAGTNGSQCNSGSGMVIGYNAAGQVGSQQDQLGRTTSFTYTGDPTSATGGTTTVTDPAGNVVVDTYQFGVLTAETKGSGTLAAATWSYTYDPSSAALASVTDPDGHTTRYFHDASGDQTGEIDPLGRYTSATYNNLNEPLTKTDALGVTSTYTYDTNGNLQSVSTPLLGTGQTQTTVYTYGDSAHPGDVTQMEDPDQFNWAYTYDAYGDRQTVSDPLTEVSTTCFNADGWKLATYTPLAGSITCAVPPPSSTYETTYSYVQTNSQIDEFGDVQQVTDPLGHATSTAYDADRNVVSDTDADGNQTQYTFDLANEQTDVIRADSSDLHTDYNLDGTKHDQKDATGTVIQTFGYDPLARVTSVTDALSDTTTYVYDGVGNELSQQDPGGTCAATPATGCTSSTYDAANELTSVTYSDGATPNVSGITYDAYGQRTGMQDGTGVSSWSWDSLHRLTQFTDGHTDQVQYQYNLRGMVTQITYPGGLQVIRGYDNAGRWTSVQDWLGNATEFGYDADGNLKTAILPASTGIADTSGYDAADQLTSISDMKSGSTLFGATYGRDNAGQVTSDSSLPASESSDKYTPLNQLCYAGSANSNACTTPPSGSQAYGFDSADNLTNDNGTTQSFNTADELCWTVPGSSSNACGAAPSGATTYAYDTRGNRTTVTAPSGSATHLGYDQGDRLTSYGQGSTTIATYAYNGDGLRTSKTVSGVTSQLTWDVASSPSSLLSDGTSDYVYGPGGRLLEQVTARPAISLVGTATASGKSSSLTVTLPGGVQPSDQVFLASTEPSSTTVTTPSGYTVVATVTSGGRSPATTTVYRHTVATGDTAVTLTYSSSKTAQAVQLAVYRGADPTAAVDVSGTGSSTGATTVTAPSVTPAYANDRLILFQGASGTFNHTTWTAPSGTTEQVQDNSTSNVSGGIADQALVAPAPTGTRTSTFSASTNLNSVVIAASQPPVVLFAHADQLGSTRLLTDTAGVARGSFTYDPYGNVTATSGSYSTAFLFAGQYKDAESGLYFLRARFYDPSSAQFLSRDPALASTRSPYAYVGGNPLNSTDPGGEASLSESTGLAASEGSATAMKGCGSTTLISSRLPGPLVPTPGVGIIRVNWGGSQVEITASPKGPGPAFAALWVIVAVKLSGPPAIAQGAEEFPATDPFNTGEQHVDLHKAVGVGATLVFQFFGEQATFNFFVPHRP